MSPSLPLTQAVQVVYLTGSGRSGSTLFERILNSANAVSGVGELHCLWRMRLDELVCACGFIVAEDPFWIAVLDRASLGPDELGRLRDAEQQLCRSSTVARSRFSLLRLAANAAAADYLALQRRLYDAIGEEAGATVVVDTSKAGPRAWVVAIDPDVVICHLYRDPADVLQSWRSKKFDKGLGALMKRPGLLTATFDWAKVEILGRALRRRTDVVPINYAEMAAQPRMHMDAIFEHAKLRAEPTIAWSDDRTFSPGREYHSVNGNPDRFGSGDVTIDVRRTAPSGLSRVDRLSSSIIGAVLRLFFRPPHKTWQS